MNKAYVEFFNKNYVKGLWPMFIYLKGSGKFDTPRRAKDFLDEEKSDYIKELLERRKPHENDEYKALTILRTEHGNDSEENQEVAIA